MRLNGILGNGVRITDRYWLYNGWENFLFKLLHNNSYG